MAIKAFACFVPVGLVRQLLHSEQKLELGGQSRFLTIFFSDVEGFSTMAETMPSRDLLARMSTLLELVSKVVHEEAGTIDKFIGDGVMAFWGAPGLLDDHAWHACVAALRIQRALEELNRQWREAGEPEMRVRIGIHSDAVLVGNVGSQERMSYTVIGDGVNIASRLEGINKTYGTLTCISHDTFREAGDRLCVRPIDEVAVKGRRARIAIYELLGAYGAGAGAGALARGGAARTPHPPGVRGTGRRRPPDRARPLPRDSRAGARRSHRRAACPSSERPPCPRRASEWCVSTTDPPAPATAFWPSQYTAALLQALRLHPEWVDGARVLEIGCGSGVLLAAAGRLGAAALCGVDLEPAAVAATRTPAAGARPGRAFEVHQGDLFAPVHGRRFELILANLPHFPMEAGADRRSAADLELGRPRRPAICSIPSSPAWATTSRRVVAP